MLVWRPRVRCIPLESRLEERDGDRAVVPVHDHVDDGEEPERFSRVAQKFIRYDTIPEWVKRRGREYVIARVGC